MRHRNRLRPLPRPRVPSQIKAHSSQKRALGNHSTEPPPLQLFLSLWAFFLVRRWKYENASRELRIGATICQRSNDHPFLMVYLLIYRGSTTVRRSDALCTATRGPTCRGATSACLSHFLTWRDFIFSNAISAAEPTAADRDASIPIDNRTTRPLPHHRRVPKGTGPRQKGRTLTARRTFSTTARRCSTSTRSTRRDSSRSRSHSTA